MSQRRTQSIPHTTADHSLTVARGIALVWHVAALFVLTYALRRLPVHAAMSGFNIEEQFGSHYQFLTVLGLWFSRLTTLFAISSDISPASTGLVRIKTLLSALTMPAEILISLLYWPILFFNAELLIPPRKVADPLNPAQFIFETVRLPLLDDLSFHAAPAIFLLIDHLAFQPPFPKEIRPAFISALSTGLYGTWVQICHAKNGTYPYPLMAILTDVQRVGLYLVCALVFVGITLSVTALHKLIDRTFDRHWGQTPIQGSVKQVNNSASRKKSS